MMTIEARKIEVVQHVLGNIDEATLAKLESIIASNRDALEQQWKEKMGQRALKSEQDIADGKLYDRQQLEKELSGRIDI